MILEKFKKKSRQIWNLYEREILITSLNSDEKVKDEPYMCLSFKELSRRTSRCPKHLIPTDP